MNLVSNGRLANRSHASRWSIGRERQASAGAMYFVIRTNISPVDRVRTLWSIGQSIRQAWSPICCHLARNHASKRNNSFRLNNAKTRVCPRDRRSRNNYTWHTLIEENAWSLFGYGWTNFSSCLWTTRLNAFGCIRRDFVRSNVFCWIDWKFVSTWSPRCINHKSFFSQLNN